MQCFLGQYRLDEELCNKHVEGKVNSRLQLKLGIMGILGTLDMMETRGEWTSEKCVIFEKELVKTWLMDEWINMDGRFGWMDA